MLLLLAFLACSQKDAQANIRLISDEETELFLQSIIKPIYTSANIPFNRNKIYIVEDNSLNAFVGDENNLFVHTGTIIAADNRSELEGVLAHETGHIQGGHILRQKIKNKQMQQVTLASTILAGAAAAVSGRGDVGVAIALGAQSSAMSHYAGYRVEEERNADEAAITLLKKTQQSPQGMLNFMKKIEKNNMLNGIDENQYFRTHPITRERVAFLEEATNTSAYKDTKIDDEEFKRVKAKLIAFLDTPNKTLQKYPLTDKSIAAGYARSIAYFKALKINQALNEINLLIDKEPNNPFFHEMKAQIYMETGKVALAQKEYEKALELLPNSALFQLNLAQATLENNPSKTELEKTVKILNQSLIKRPSGMAWLLLSRAYGGINNEAYSNYAAAEYSFIIGADKIARQQAMNAKKKALNNPKLTTKIDDLLERLNSLIDK